MNKWAPIAPAKAGGPSSSSRFAAVLKPSKPGAAPTARVPLVGRWPESILLQIVSYLPIPDLPRVARVNRAFSRLVRDEAGWRKRCQLAGISPDAPAKPTAPKTPAKAAVALEDDFGDFSSSNDVFEDVDFGDMQSGSRTNGNLLDFDDLPLPSKSAGTKATGFFSLAPATSATPGPAYAAYKAHHTSLVPLCRHLRSSTSPSSTLSLLFPVQPMSAAPPLAEQSKVFLSLLLFLSPALQPLHDWGFLRQALLAAADRFESTCLVAFEVADGRHDEAGMRLAAESSWKVWDAGGGSREQWECGRVWVEKREVFYETSKWDSLENIVYVRIFSSNEV